MTPAFKEWQSIVAALGAGAQALVLRKGGIHEGRGGFQPETADRFWLFPTRFHAQREKTKPAAANFFEETAPADVPSSTRSLRYVAERVESWFVTDWARLQALGPHHLWTEATVRERFEWSRPPGIHVLLLRVFAAHPPAELALTPEMSGCKSWITVPTAWPAELRPVLDEKAFSAQAAAVRSVLGAP